MTVRGNQIDPNLVSLIGLKSHNCHTNYKVVKYWARRARQGFILNFKLAKVVWEGRKSELKFNWDWPRCWYMTSYLKPSYLDVSSLILLFLSGKFCFIEKTDLWMSTLKHGFFFFSSCIICFELQRHCSEQRGHYFSLLLFKLSQVACACNNNGFSSGTWCPDWLVWLQYLYTLIVFVHLKAILVI